MALVAAAATATVGAHRRDEYLQAARIAIEAGRVDLQLDLTPGVSLADRVIALTDRNADGRVSPFEARQYALAVGRDTGLEVDGRSLQLQLRDVSAPTVEAMARGEGTLQLRWDAVLPPLAAGKHRLHFRNSHQPEVSVYMANVLVPSTDRVAVSAQDRDVDQRNFTVEYELRDGRRTNRLGVLAAGGGVVLAGLVARLSAPRRARIFRLRYRRASTARSRPRRARPGCTGAGRARG